MLTLVVSVGAPAGASAAGRSVEIVTPPDGLPYAPGGGNIAGATPTVAARPNGDAYWISGPNGGDPAADDGGALDVFIARRGEAAWTSEWLSDFAAPMELQHIVRPVFGMDAEGAAYETPANIATADENEGHATTFFDGVWDLYRSDATGHTLLSSTPGGPSGYAGAIQGTSFVTPDLSAIVFKTNDSLLPVDTDGMGDVYLRRADGLHLVSIKTDGTPDNDSFVDASPIFGDDLTGGWAANHGFTSVSSDGSTVVFVTDAPLDPADHDFFSDLYVWRNGTVSLVSDQEVNPDCGEDFADFCPGTLAGMSEDGDVVYFTSKEQLAPGDADTVDDLYAYRPESGILTLASGGADEEPAHPVTVSANGTLFFATAERIGADPPPPESTLVIYRWDGTSITTVAERDPSELANDASDNPVAPIPRKRAVRAAADGSALVFSTIAQLAPGDADSALDVYLWRAGEGLTLVSGGGSAPARLGGQLVADENLLSGRIISPTASVVFFNSTDDLTGEAVGGDPKVYAWHAAGGLELITDAPGGARYADSTPDGSDVFFLTTAALDPRDTDGGEADLYDARTGPVFPVPSSGGSSDVGGPAPTPGAGGGGGLAPPPIPSTGSGSGGSPTGPPGTGAGPDGPTAEPTEARLDRRRLNVRGRFVGIDLDLAGAGEVNAQLYKPGRNGRPGRLLARGSTSFTDGAADRPARLRLTKKGRRAVVNARRTKAVLRITVTPADGSGPSSETYDVTVRR